jgi:hypothetical protein
MYSSLYFEGTHMSAPHTTENLTIHFKVKDYASWRTGYNARETTRRSASRLTKGGVFRNPDDPNDVVVLQDVSDVEKARTAITSAGPTILRATTTMARS